MLSITVGVNISKRLVDFVLFCFGNKVSLGSPGWFWNLGSSGSYFLSAKNTGQYHHIWLQHALMGAHIQTTAHVMDQQSAKDISSQLFGISHERGLCSALRDLSIWNQRMRGPGWLFILRPRIFYLVIPNMPTPDKVGAVFQIMVPMPPTQTYYMWEVWGPGLHFKRFFKVIWIWMVKFGDDWVDTQYPFRVLRIIVCKTAKSLNWIYIYLVK